MYSTLILAVGEREKAAKASLDMIGWLKGTAIDCKNGPLSHQYFHLCMACCCRSGTSICIPPPAHRPVVPHNPSLTDTNRFPGGNCSCRSPLHCVAAQTYIFTYINKHIRYVTPLKIICTSLLASKCGRKYTHTHTHICMYISG